MVIGTLIAWVLVRDEFPGKRLVNALIDLPFALPTIVAGLVLLALYGPDSPSASTSPTPQAAIVLALLFVTLPFVVRTVQPVLLEIDREMEEAAASLGASRFTIFRRIVFPDLLPGDRSPASALAFARAIGEYGSLVLISGNLPFKTQVASVYISARSSPGTPRRRCGLGRPARARPRWCCSPSVGLIQRWAAAADERFGGEPLGPARRSALGYLACCCSSPSA